MKTLLLSCALLFGAWFWRQPAPSASVRWPQAIPVFAGGDAVSAATLADGTSFVCLLAPGTPQTALDAARASYTADGWRESPIRAHDMLLFTRGEAVAAVLAQDTPSGTRITAIQRPHGL